MTRRERVAARAAAFAIVSMVGRPARPHEVEPIALAYEAAPGCPDAAAFFRQVTARLAGVRLARSGEYAPRLRVILRPRGSTFVGLLTLREGEVSSSPREVSGPTCGEVAAALSLVAALALAAKTKGADAPGDAGGGETPPQPAESAGATGPRAGASSSTPATDGSGAPTATAPTPAAPEVSHSTAPVEGGEQVSAHGMRAPAASEEPSSRAGATQTHFAAGAQLELDLIPDPLVAGRLFGDFEVVGAIRAWSPSLRVGVSRSLDATERASVGTATLRFTQASLEVCPLRVALPLAFVLRPCVGSSAGVLEASGAGVNEARSHTGLWVAILAHARLAWEAEPFFVEAEAGGAVPLVRDSFVFDPSVAVYQAPPLAAVGRFGVGMRFR